VLRNVHWAHKATGIFILAVIAFVLYVRWREPDPQVLGFSYQRGSDHARSDCVRVEVFNNSDHAGTVAVWVRDSTPKRPGLGFTREQFEAKERRFVEVTLLRPPSEPPYLVSAKPYRTGEDQWPE
jgi:hypothetical protein